MTIPYFLRFLLMTALISFSNRADATCLMTGTMPMEYHARDCADMGMNSDDTPISRKHKPSISSCPFACVALADTPIVPLTSREPITSNLKPVSAQAIAGGSKRPPTPPPRFELHHDINSI